MQIDKRMIAKSMVSNILVRVETESITEAKAIGLVYWLRMLFPELHQFNECIDDYIKKHPLPPMPEGTI